MYSSPPTPTGTGRNLVSNTYTRVLAIGRPIDGFRELRSSTMATVDQIVVSVGPYRFVTEAADLINDAATSAGQAPPPPKARPPLPPPQHATSSASPALPKHRPIRPSGAARMDRLRHHGQPVP